MNNVIDFNSIKSKKDKDKLDEKEKIAYEFALNVDDISLVIAEALDNMNASQVEAAVAMQVFVNKICKINDYFSEEDIQKGAAFFNNDKELH